MRKVEVVAHPRKPLTIAMAINEAKRCLLCTEPACNEGCPAGVDVRRFVGAIATGDFVEAIKALYEKNVLPLSCAYICPVDKQCVERCSHTEINFPVMVDRLQQWVSRHAIEQNLYALRPAADNGRRVAVVGGGPSGLAAATELRLRGCSVTVFERTDSLGGMLRHCVPTFRLPREALDLEIEIIRRTGVEFKTGTPVTEADGLLEDGYDAVYLATGLWKSASLDLPGSNGPDVFEALPFLMDCASDGRTTQTYALAGKRVVIVGGGSVAMDVSACAVRLGARSVTLAALESPAEMPVVSDEIQRAWSDGVIFESRVMPLAILREEKGAKGLRLVRIEWREPGVIHPSNAVPIEAAEFTLPAWVIFFAVGQRPDEESNRLTQHLDMSQSLTAADNETLMTSREGLFAGGDLVRGGGTAAEAIADGKRAGKAIMSYLDGMDGEVAR